MSTEIQVATHPVATGHHHEHARGNDAEQVAGLRSPVRNGVGALAIEDGIKQPLRVRGAIGGKSLLLDRCGCCVW